MSSGTNDESNPREWLTLDEDEVVEWTEKPHRSSLIPALIIGIPLSVLIVGLFIIAAAYLQRENTQYVVTTDGLYKKTGVLSRDVQRIDFGKVQNTSYSQGFFGSRYGYGTVDISTAGGSGVEMQFRSVPEPRQVQERINKRVKSKREDESSSSSGETKADVLEDILTELQSIRQTLEADRESSWTDATSDDSSDREPGSK
jgi:membrane protein YdbS with pleckstrin-like domain